jgi:hypothetical protein
MGPASSLSPINTHNRTMIALLGNNTHEKSGASRMCQGQGL